MYSYKNVNCLVTSIKVIRNILSLFLLLERDYLKLNFNVFCKLH